MVTNKYWVKEYSFVTENKLTNEQYLNFKIKLENKTISVLNWEYKFNFLTNEFIYLKN